jgi:hypothetical protein
MATLRPIAAKLFWWRTPEEAMADRTRFVGQVMTLGTWDDIQAVRRALGDAWFVRALDHAPPGVFDARSWNYWHRVLRNAPPPPLPRRRLP